MYYNKFEFYGKTRRYKRRAARHYIRLNTRHIEAIKSFPTSVATQQWIGEYEGWLKEWNNYLKNL